MNNHSLMRENNITTILTTIMNNPEISRAEISKQTNLNKATVSEIVRNLILNHYVLETGTGESSSSGGRKPIFLKINKEAGISFSFDVRYDKLSYMVNHLNGNLITMQSFEININRSNIINMIKNIIINYKKHLDSTPFGIIGITIAIHGVVSNNEIIFTPYYDLKGLPIAETLENELDIPVQIENEANLAALAEASFNPIHNNLISCSIHTGVGAGVMLDKKLYHGYRGSSGEIGHTTLYPGGLKCPCGKKGCLEQYCSQSSLLKNYQSKLNNKQLTIDNLIMDYNNQQIDAVNLINEFSENLSIGIANLIGFYGPEIIYLNSKIVKEIPNILNIISNNLNETIHKDIPIKVSQVAERASLYGASVMNIQNFLNINHLKLSLK